MQLSTDAQTLAAYYARKLSSGPCRKRGYCQTQDDQITKKTGLERKRIWAAKEELIAAGLIRRQACYFHPDGEPPVRVSDRIRAPLPLGDA